MLFSASRYPIAIDLSGDRMYVAQLRRARSELRVVDAVAQARAAEDPGAFEPARVKQFLKSSLRRGSFRGRTALLSLPHTSLISQPVRFEPRAGDSVEAAMVQEVARKLTYPVQDAVIDYASLRTVGGPRSKVLEGIVIAARRELVEGYLDAFRSAGLVLEAITSGGVALIRLHRHLYPPARMPDLLCFCDDDYSMLAAVTSDNILVYRTFTWGTSQMLGTIRAQLELGDDDQSARQLLSQYGLMYETDRNERNATGEDDDISRTLYQIISPFVGQLVFELHNMTAYIRSAEQGISFQRIYLYGQAAALRGLDRYVESQLNIPAESVDPSVRFPHRRGGSYGGFDGPLFSIALGLALRGMKWL
jgi:type IV pilus assembly protein PilM